jgi:lipopolysaccharide transport system ATP-binding protein
MSTVISVEHLSKVYRLGMIGGATLQEDLTRWWAKMRGRPDPLFKIGQDHHAQRVGEQFWALQGVNFDVQEGQVLGIIGRNGAGKSTLLKILSQVTAPTSGQITIRGRLASLLEVGTGFHPELTGRENIFLNGAILGMTKTEIRRKLDEIIAFAEIPEFIDTPVKRYSSGMYVRLAFAVAAHLEPEILVVDEVLAVGDAAFQKKCLGKMGEVAKRGRTVLFVSHNMAAMSRLCTTGVWLRDGRVEASGAAADIVNRYLSDGSHTSAEVVFDARPHATIQYRAVSVTDANGTASQQVPDDQGFTIKLSIDVLEDTPEIYFGFVLQNADGINVLFADSRDFAHSFPPRLTAGTYVISVRLPPVLAPNTYQVMSLGIATTNPVRDLDLREVGCSFDVVNNSNSQRTAARPGIVNLHLPWNLAGR